MFSQHDAFILNCLFFNKKNSTGLNFAILLIFFSFSPLLNFQENYSLVSQYLCTWRTYQRAVGQCFINKTFSWAIRYKMLILKCHRGWLSLMLVCIFVLCILMTFLCLSQEVSLSLPPARLTPPFCHHRSFLHSRCLIFSSLPPSLQFSTILITDKRASTPSWG